MISCLGSSHLPLLKSLDLIRKKRGIQDIGIMWQSLRIGEYRREDLIAILLKALEKLEILKLKV